MQLKEDKMTADERWVALLNRKPVDRVGIQGLTLGFSGLNSGYSIYDMYYDAEKGFNGHRWAADMYGWQPMMTMGQGSWPTKEFGGDLKPPRGAFIQSPLPIFPVKTKEDAWNLKKPDVRTLPGMEALWLESNKMADRAGESFIFPVAQGAWTSATMVTGVGFMGMAVKQDPEVAHHLLKMMNAFTIEKMQMYADTFGAERIIPWMGHASAANQIIGPKVFEEFCFPYILEQYKAFLGIGCKHIMCHICGYHAMNYPMWAQVPMGDPGIVSVAHDVDADWTSPLESAAKYFPNDIIYGNIEPAQFQIGTPEDIYERCRKAIEIGKRHEPGFILAPGCEMPPTANPYNVWMMTKAVNDFGWYE